MDTATGADGGTQTGTRTRWWQNATGYQVYPRSFADSDGDGMGDIPGITDKLDHLADLGVGFVWLSPVYASPMADNGYDISDYRDIAPEFGTLADFDRLVEQARARGIGIVMDLVVNHCSAAHPWFRAARASRDAPGHDWFIWRDPAPDGGPPDDQRACFGGSAWLWVPEVGRYCYCHFSPEQVDLNWENPALRAEIYEMMNWWCDRGIAGFRMDVISLLGKDVDARIYEEGPRLHEFLQEMHREVLAGRDLLTIGESWGVSRETALLYCGRDRGELGMVFQFTHILEGWDEALGKWRPRPFDLVRFKKVMDDWQEALADDGWNALFLSNHDLPRQVSRYGSERYRKDSAKALATALHLMKGTPFVYQGEEIGMTNAGFTRIDQYRDLETLGHYTERIAEGIDPAEFLEGAARFSRDNSRTPMQWDESENAGFTTGTPWIELAHDWRQVNVAADRADPGGVFAHYRHLIALRRELPIVAHGRYRPFLREHGQAMAYTRALDGKALAVIVNLSERPCTVEVPAGMRLSGEALVATHGMRDLAAGDLTLAPYEAVAVLGPAVPEPEVPGPEVPGPEVPA